MFLVTHNISLLMAVLSSTAVDRTHIRNKITEGDIFYDYPRDNS